MKIVEGSGSKARRGEGKKSEKSVQKLKRSIKLKDGSLKDNQD